MNTPRGRRTLGQPISFASLRSANPILSLSTPHRTDPYWGCVWGVDHVPRWLSRSRGDVTRPAQEVDPAEAVDRRLSARGRSATLDVLGALDLWREGTDEQIAAITSHRALVAPYSTAVSDLYAASLVEVGYGYGARSYRPSDTHAFRDRITPRLTHAEWVSVTGGQPYDDSRYRRTSRYHVLATELGLRLAEYSEVEAVLGEKLATHTLLGHTGLGFPEPVKRMLTGADLVVVREDGVRIAIELTASGGSSVARRIERWAALLQDRRMDASGLAVVFVSVTPATTKGSARWSVRSKLHRMVAAAANRYPGVSYDRTGARIGVADWREWFPSFGHTTQAAIDLEVDVMDTKLGWERRSFLDLVDLPFSPTDHEPFLAALTNLALIRGNPHWLRARRAPVDLVGATRARSDLSSVVAPGRRFTDAQRAHFPAARPLARLRGIS